MKISFSRRFMDGLRMALIYLSIALVCALVLGMIGYIFFRGLPNITWELLSTTPSVRADRIGILPDLLNTLYIVVMTVIYFVHRCDDGDYRFAAGCRCGHLPDRICHK